VLQDQEDRVEGFPGERGRVPAPSERQRRARADVEESTMVLSGSAGARPAGERGGQGEHNLPAGSLLVLSSYDLRSERASLAS
jgi:hypothetical protein